jgi:hypothetical protein
MTDHPYVCTCDKCVDAGSGIPNFLRRVPLVKVESIGTEGGPFYDLWTGADPAKPGSDRTVFQCTCGLMSGECKRAGCPYKLSPEANPPASFPWERPPSGSKS